MSLDRRQMEAALPAYDVGAEIGRGAFGLVFEGHHRALGRRVAIKQLPRALGADPAVQARFAGEARVVAALDHPHIVRVYDYVEHEGLRLLVMEYLPGGTLAQRAAARPLTQAAACATALCVASALRHAHEHGVLHRDVKPENVLFGADGTPKLADFGIAKLTEADARLTSTGTVVGTVSYMSPEQARGDELTGASDVYACALVLYELLAGRLPFPPLPSVTGQLVQRVTEQALPLHEVAPSVPAPIADVVTRALARDVGDRYADAASFRAALLAAGTAAWGPGWVAASGVPVVDTAADARTLPEQPVPAGVAAAAATSGSRAVPASAAPRTAEPTTAPRGVATVPAETRPVRRSPKLAVAIGLVVVVVAGALAALVLGGGGGGDPTAAAESAPAVTTTVPVTTAAASTVPEPTTPPTAPPTAPPTTPPTTLAVTTVPPTTAAPVTVVVTVLVPTPTAAAATVPPPTTVVTTKAVGDRAAAVSRVNAACQGLGRSDVNCACIAQRLTGLNAVTINAIALSVETKGVVPARFEARFAPCLLGGATAARRR